MRRIAFTFVHGINNGPKERAELRDVMHSRLNKNGLLMDFVVPRSNDFYLNIAEWQSVGDFMMDLAALTKEDWRNAAIDSVSKSISFMQEKLDNEWGTIRGEQSPLHVILMHSMGQPLGISALISLKKQNKMKVRTAVVSIGGPLGNKNPAFKTYLNWCTKEISWWNPAGSFQLDSWTDVHNPDDPICTDFALGYSPCRGVTKSIEFNYPGKPDIFHPVKEHSSYFDTSDLYKTLRSVIDQKTQ